MMKNISTGRQINRDKSAIVFNKRVNDGEELVGILGFQVFTLSIKYLRTLLKGRSIKHSDCDLIITDLNEILTRE